MMTTEQRRDELQALEAELHGIKTELESKIPIHRSLSIAIDALRAEENEIAYRIHRLKREQRETQSS